MATPDIRFQGFTGKWKTRQFSETSNMGSGGTPNAGIPGNYGGLIPFIRSGEIDKTETQLFITNRGLHTSSARLVAEGDLLLAIYGGSSGSIEGSTAGESAISKINGAINQAILAIYPSVEFDKLFMLSWFKAHKKEIIGTHLQGSQGNLSARIVGALDYVSPPLDEQSSIGIFLSKIDELLAKNKDRVSQLRKYKQSMLVKMFPQDGASVPEIRFEGFTGNWELKTIENIAAKTLGGGTPATSHAEYWNGDIPWIQSSDLSGDSIENPIIRKRVSEPGIKNSATMLIPENSIAVVTRVGVGKVSMMLEPYATSQDFISLADIKGNLRFITIAVKQTVQASLSQLQGSTIKGITRDELLSKKLRVPSTEEQTAISSYFRQLDKLIELEEAKLAKLTQLKTAFLSKMFV